MDKECVLRRLWYAEAQKKEFKGSESSSSDDEIQFYEESSSKMEQSASADDDSKEDKSISNEEKPPVLTSPPPSRHKFSNFASALGAESRFDICVIKCVAHDYLFRNLIYSFQQQSNRKGSHC